MVTGEARLSNIRQNMEQQPNEEQERPFQEVQQQAEELGVGILRTASGFKLYHYIKAGR